MGLSISYPPDDYLPAVEDNMGRLFIRSLSFDDMEAEAESPSALLPAFGSSKLIIEGSLSFKRREADNVEMETTLSIRSPKPERECCNINTSAVTAAPSRLGSIIDCPPTLRWSEWTAQGIKPPLSGCRRWKLLDFALLKRNSVSFFDIEKPETAVSKWSRARMRAAKVGKGLSKDEKAQKLALQHWLEAIDPRHRYGHNLHFYYHRWLHCQSKQLFFYWLDVGEGKDVSLDEHCPRWKLHKQCIKYLGPVSFIAPLIELNNHSERICSASEVTLTNLISCHGVMQEREAYEVIVEDARLMYKLSRQIVDTTGSDKGIKWIFVLSTCKNLYIGQKQKGVFQHSSFLAGGATSAAGRLVVDDGILKVIEQIVNFKASTPNLLLLDSEFVQFRLCGLTAGIITDRAELSGVHELPEGDSVDLTNVKVRIKKRLSPSEGEEDADFSLKGGQSQLDLTELCEPEDEQEAQPSQDHDDDEIETRNDEATVPSIGTETSTPTIPSADPGCKSRLQGKRPPRLQINSNNRIPIPPTAHSNTRPSSGIKDIVPDSAMFGGCLEFCKTNLFMEEGYEEGDLVEVPAELILNRINSKRSMRSYQLGKQLSFQWSTGAGPRIGCVRDYPSELQFLALEEVSLSPQGSRAMRFTSPRPSALTPNSIPTTQGDNMNISLRPRQRSVTWAAF
ncbi:hypothetical protein PR202_ga00205 [Eleusine coracana subsp. coracana]|uniref:Uncharacterized protein n=1 Tax=Eleusine coracana subsp. coracana TaxID=191504 RepID=A0AAV5BBK3_ELECO|nr:hypothetical protein PR202_ga00205 [Eleusine coracana subsp. coracana]